MNRTEKIIWAIAMLAVADPALAGLAAPVPAPAIGIGIGTIVVLGIGYRALKQRIHR